MAGFPIIPGTAGALKQLTTLSGGTFTPTQSGLYLISLTGGGGGGGGGASAVGSAAGLLGYGGGGGAGGVTTQIIQTLVAGTAYSYTLGAGGTAGAGGVAAAGAGGQGGTGGDSIFVGPGATLHAPGGGGGAGGVANSIVANAAISGQIITLTMLIAIPFGNSDLLNLSSMTGGAWANANGNQQVIAQNSTAISLLCMSLPTLPSGTYTANSGFAVQAFTASGGIPGGGGPTFHQLMFGPGYGSGAIQNAGGIGVAAIGPGFGLAAAGGGNGGASGAAGGNGGTGGGAGNYSAPGTQGANASSGSGTGTAGTNGVANTSAGAGGGGASNSLNAGGAGGVGGTGQAFVLGPF